MSEKKEEETEMQVGQIMDNPLKHKEQPINPRTVDCNHNPSTVGGGAWHSNLEAQTVELLKNEELTELEKVTDKASYSSDQE